MAHDPKKEIESVNASYFLDFYDEEFVQEAYAKLLRRAPDASGRAHYLGLLRSGDSRYQILDSLSRSSECRNEGVRLNGMTSYRWIKKIQAIPVLAQLAQTLLFIWRINRFMKDLRALENHVYRVSSKVGDL